MSDQRGSGQQPIDQSAVVSHEEFTDELDALASDRVAEPWLGALMAHYHSCADCRAQLDEYRDVLDAVLVATPPVAPSAGFARETASLMRSSNRPAANPWVRRTLLAAAALLLVAVGVTIGRSTTDSGSDNVAVSAPIVNVAGETIGRYSELDSVRSVAVVELNSPKPFDGRRSCVIVTADGVQHTIGSWTKETMATGAWSMAIAPEVVDATPVRMDIVGEDGSVIASAEW
jgi:hypothetical protein